MTYIEKKLYLIQVSSRLTATSARLLFQIFIPACVKRIEFSGGKMESYSIEKKTYLLCLCTPKIRKRTEFTLKYVVSSTDVTDKIINDTDYQVNDSVLKYFDYASFEKAYTDCYLEEATPEHARMRIKAQRNKSRYIDHKLLFSKGLKP